MVCSRSVSTKDGQSSWNRARTIKIRGSSTDSDGHPGERNLRMSDMISLTLVRYPPTNPLGRSSETGVWVLAGRFVMVSIALLWLPAGFYVLSAATGDTRWPGTAISWISLTLLAAGGLPLAAACHRLALNGYSGTAWAAGAVLGLSLVPLSLAAEWHGAAGVAVLAAVASLPVWIAVLWLGHRTRTGHRQRTSGAATMALMHGSRSIR